MKIVLVTNIFPPHTRGGYELGCREIGRALAALGHDVHVVTSLPVGSLCNSPGAPDLHVHEIFDPVFGFDADLAGALSESATWCHEWSEAFTGVHYGNALALGRWLTLHRPDVVWLFNTIGLGPVGILESARSTTARVLTLLMDDIDGYLLRSRRNLSWVPRVRRLKSGIDAISCSALTRDTNRAIGDYRRHVVIPNGMPFPPRPSRPARDGTAFSFCYFGQIEEAKGLLDIVRASNALRVQRPALAFDVHVYGTGARGFSNRLTTAIADAGLTAQFTLHGFVERQALMPRLQQHDAALLLLRDGEPFGYAPLEAAVAGLPAIVSRRVGAVECLRTDYPLLVDDRGDAHAVARLMAWCVDHRAQLPALAAQTFDDFRARCEFDTVTLPAYLEAIAQTPPTTRPTSIESLIASCRTTDLYAQSRGPVERLRGTLLGEPVVGGPLAASPETSADRTPFVEIPTLAPVWPQQLRYLIEEADLTQIWDLPIDRAVRRILAQGTFEQHAVSACELPDAPALARALIVRSAAMPVLARLIETVLAVRPDAIVHVVCHAADVTALRERWPGADIRTVVYPQAGRFETTVLAQLLDAHVPRDVSTTFYLDNDPVGSGASLEHVYAALATRPGARVYIFNANNVLHDSHVARWTHHLGLALPALLRWWGTRLPELAGARIPSSSPLSRADAALAVEK